MANTIHNSLEGVAIAGVANGVTELNGVMISPFYNGTSRNGRLAVQIGLVNTIDE